MKEEDRQDFIESSAAEALQQTLIPGGRVFDLNDVMGLILEPFFEEDEIADAKDTIFDSQGKQILVRFLNSRSDIQPANIGPTALWRPGFKHPVRSREIGSR